MVARYLSDAAVAPDGPLWASGGITSINKSSGCLGPRIGEPESREAVPLFNLPGIPMRYRPAECVRAPRAAVGGVRRSDTSHLSSAPEPERRGSTGLPAGSGRPRHLWGRWLHHGHHDPSRDEIQRGLVSRRLWVLGRSGAVWRHGLPSLLSEAIYTTAAPINRLHAAPRFQ